MQRAPKGWHKFRTIGPITVYQNTKTGKLATLQPESLYTPIKEWDSIDQIEAWLKEHAVEQGGIDVLLASVYNHTVGRATIFKLPDNSYATAEGKTIKQYRTRIMRYDETTAASLAAIAQRIQDLQAQINFQQSEWNKIVDQEYKAFYAEHKD